MGTEQTVCLEELGCRSACHTEDSFHTNDSCLSLSDEPSCLRFTLVVSFISGGRRSRLESNSGDSQPLHFQWTPCGHPFELGLNVQFSFQLFPELSNLRETVLLFLLDELRETESQLRWADLNFQYANQWSISSLLNRFFPSTAYSPPPPPPASYSAPAPPGLFGCFVTSFRIWSNIFTSGLPEFSSNFLRNIFC